MDEIMKSEGAWVLRIYTEETDETCIRLFHSRKAAIDYVKSIVDWNWDVEYGGDVAGKPARIRDAEKSLEEDGYWNDDGTLYVLSEEEFIG